MRRLRGVAVLLFTALAAVIIICLVGALPNRLVFKGGNRYTFYVGNTSKNCRVVSCSVAEAGLTRLTLQGVCGESVTFSRLDIDEFLKSVNGEIIETQPLDDSVNYYCKADLPYSIELFQTSINLHICVREDSVIVGSPIIFGGY
ncbi:MAG: hypothetical protein K2N50_05270 [Clostridia bacterium]|nr:hypothetical protein [Clostridia bacterium]